VTDFYEMDVTITSGGKTVTKSGIKHALHTTIGNAATPPGLEVLLRPPRSGAWSNRCCSMR
jgi:hypothetical protein